MPEHPEQQSIPRRRFVVLQHSDRDGIHYDLMIQHHDALATWKSNVPPEQLATTASTLSRIPDHRAIYLDYEGPVSNDRGHVERHDAGTCQVHLADDDAWDVTFNGTKLSGRIRLEYSIHDQSWRFFPAGS